MSRIFNFLALSAFTAFTYATPIYAAGSADPLITPAGFELGALVSDYEYREPSLDVKLSGTRWGIAASYTGNIGPRLPFIVFDIRHSRGSLKYEGSGTLTGVPDQYTEARMLIGHDFLPKGKVGLALYGGFGYRYLYNDNRGTTSTGAIGYRRYSEYRYLPIGLTARFRAGADWIIAPNVEYDIFLSGTQKTKLTDTGIGFSDATNDQTKGYGYRASVMFERRQMSFGPWMHYWSIDKSDETDIGFGYVAYEPKNWTREIGAEFKYRF